MANNQRKRQILNMADKLEKIEGVGKISMDVFHRAGFNTIGDLKEEDGYAHRIQDAMVVLRGERTQYNDVYWRALGRRCTAIIERVRNAEAFPFVPSQYMCTISLDWMEDPVVSPSGFSYDRAELKAWLIKDPRDPKRENLLLLTKFIRIGILKMLSRNTEIISFAFQFRLQINLYCM
ncbi:unnamed protein product [Rhizophagus irregularis]|uniref:U-box domain-containing protein n=1 Tax=Rhizophagus irregularis TaxID=588596 RepID=A0A2I1GMH5_9GLOM|nr:hypothetical protein RhiirA4_523570 [Rhizophagus irregularis]CAB4435722.1 unnamed protein product [Rhizophagus irregularis]